MTGLALAAVIAGAGAAVAYYQGQQGTEAAADSGDAREASTDGTPTEQASDSPDPSPSTSPTPDESDVPATGPGTFTIAKADGSVVGEGSNLRRYRVMVETNIDIPADDAAEEIAKILADQRGWTRDGLNSFQLVSSGSYDFTVKISTPGTTDDICGAYGLDTGGEVNCAVGKDVVVNLKRWMLGSPQFDGPVSEYRALIINHEVGHRIGHGHETCSGEGEKAPAMMQQIKGLKGCVSNAWPYEEDGTYIGGPSVP